MLNQAVDAGNPGGVSSTGCGAPPNWAWRILSNFWLNVWWIRFQASKTFLKFAAVGSLGVVVNLGLFILLVRFGLSKYLASPISIEVFHHLQLSAQ